MKEIDIKPWKCYNCKTEFTSEQLSKLDYKCNECSAEVFTKKQIEKEEKK